MVIKPYVLILIIAALLVVDVYLLVRYASWGCAIEELIPFAVFLLIAEGLSVFSIVRLAKLSTPLLFIVFSFISRDFHFYWYQTAK